MLKYFYAEIYIYIYIYIYIKTVFIFDILGLRTAQS